jgi:hypothetical protein
LAKADDPDSVGALADEIFSFPRPYMRLPADIEAKLKTRIVKAELAFMQGTAPGVQEGDISNLINLIAQTLGAPDYAMTSPAQLRHLRMSLAIAEPKFIGKGLGHHEHIGDSISPTLSPLQAMHLILSLFDQKLINPEFQLSPADWQTKHQGLEADNVGKAGATIQQNPKRHEIEAILSQNIAAMNPGDAQRIIDESFFALGIH